MEELKKKLKKVNAFKYILEKEDDMNVPVEIYISEKLIDTLDEKSINQIKNVASLPGIVGKAMIMPDVHMGYGFPVGGVAAFDSKKGIISPGGIGYDINCGVRLLRTNLKRKEVEGKTKKLLDIMFSKVPCGVGIKSKLRLEKKELDAVLKTGASWAVKNGYGVKEDLEFCEENGNMKSADPSKISNSAKARGRNQLGTLGAGNHFLEIQYIDKILDEAAAKTFGLEKDNVAIMIHCGSRGLGHQVCSDYLRKMEDTLPEIMENIPDRELAYAPADSKIAKDYFKAMSAAANFAWCNRHIIAQRVRESFIEVFGDKIKIDTVYDVAHNMAKLEKHKFDGKEIEVYVHRKGATRAFGPNLEEVPKKYRKVGQPIILPGSMGTASYVLVGSKTSMDETFGSTAHGAGRTMSRHQANKVYSAEKVKRELEERKIYIKSRSWKGISEEAPGAYKDVDEVVQASHDAGIGNLVVRLRPMGVLKG
jgi:tRNA-splicing ligase RtcB